MTKLKLYSPLKDFFITQKFGENATPIYGQLGLVGHNGLDMRAPDSTPVYASHDGRVTFAGYDGSGGLGVVIRTNEEMELLDGSTSYIKSISWHLKKNSLLVTGGQQVVAGQQIAQADNTGLSTGSHLHFGLKPIAKGENDWTWLNTEQTNGYMGAIDPQPYLVEKFIPFKYPMRKGDFSDDVQMMQAFFLRTGYMQPIPQGEFGWYGDKTCKAVKSFMVDSGKLSAWETIFWYGKNVGPKTLAELNLRYR